MVGVGVARARKKVRCGDTPPFGVRSRVRRQHSF